MSQMKQAELAAGIVAAFVSSNSLPRSELGALIEAMHSAVRTLAEGSAPTAVVVEPPQPAVSIGRSITPDYLICLEDGKKFKSLRRHLAGLGLTPEQYRTKWVLPLSYPMVAPNYAAKRSAIAKTSGLGFGRLRGKSAAAPVAKEITAAPTKAKAKRKRDRPSEITA